MPKVQITNNFVVKTICSKDKIKEVYYDIELIGFLLEVRQNQIKKVHYMSFHLISWN